MESQTIFMSQTFLAKFIFRVCKS